MRDFLAANKVSSLKPIKVPPDENICKTTCREMVSPLCSFGSLFTTLGNFQNLK